MAPDAVEQTNADASSPGRLPASTRSTKAIRIPLAPIAAVVGVALIGNGVDGSTGAGVALVTAVVIGFLFALILVDGETASVSRRRTKKTLRHRVLLAVDVRRRRRATKKRQHERSKEAERDFLRRRDRRRERTKDL